MSDMKGIEISDILGLSQPLTKFIETISCGIGTVYKPFHITRMAKARAEEIKLISDAVEDRINLPITYKYGNVEIDSSNTDNLLERTQHRVLFEEAKRQNNIESVISHTYNELENTQSVDSKPVDDDWITRFFNIAKDISSEDMQQIWGKILAGEIVKPGSFSMRTLDTIRNISQQEASAFQRVVPCICRAGNDLVITSENEMYGKYGISYSDILLLDECGLMVSSGTLSITQKCKESETVVVFTEENVLIASCLPENQVEIRYWIHTLTSAGKELYRILAHNPNEEYFFDFSEHIFNQNKDASFRIHKVNRITDEAVDYEDNARRIYRESIGSTGK